jgi:hypothetical protein
MNAIRILLLSFLIPSEFNFILESFVLSAYRLILIFLIPYVVWSILTKTRAVRWNACDAFALAIGVWPMIAFGLNTGMGAAFESGGILALELVLPYLLIRLNINTHQQRIAFSKVLFLVVAILFFLGLPESISGRHFTHELASALSGANYNGSPEQRFGIWRAMGPTDHAIIFGTLCAIAMATAIAMAKRRPKFWFIAIFSGAGALMSASSAPILAVMVQLAMLAWVRITRGRKNRWWLLLGLFLAFYIVVDILSNRDPIRVMFTYLLLNPETGYARYYMWVNSFEVVAQSTWGLFFGYGYDIGIFAIIENQYWRHLLENTVDSFWLVMMLRFGLTSLLLFSIFVILVLARSLRYVFDRHHKRKRHFMQAWFITAFAMTLIATTVHFWGYMASMYMMVLAVCVGGERSRKKVEIQSRLEPSKTANNTFRRRHPIDA